MSGYCFSDLEQWSDNKKFCLSATSPDNQRGSLAFQSGFLYTLRRGEDVLWERVQGEGEESPIRLLVSDEGWCAAIAQGHDHDQILTFSQEGRLYSLVTVSPDFMDTWTGDLVIAQRGHRTSAGFFWMAGSFPLFWEYQGQPHFTLSTCWLQNITIRLEDGHFVEQPERSLENALREAQATAVAGYLNRARLLGKGWPQMPSVVGALLLLALVDCPIKARILKTWASIPDQPSSNSSCYSLEGRWRVQHLVLRPLLQALTRYLELPCHTLPCYQFSDQEGQVLKLSSTVPPPLEPTTALELLEVAGPPHYLESLEEESGSGFQWGESWEYYLGTGPQTKTLRLVWEPGSFGNKLRSAETLEVDLLERMATLCAPQLG